MNKVILSLVLNAIIGSTCQFVSAMFRTIENGSMDYSFDQYQFEKLSSTIERTRALLDPSVVLDSMDICGGFNLIADQLPNGESSCVCHENEVHCTLEGQCSEDGSICTDIVGISFEFIVENNIVTNMLLSACFSYTRDFEPTCIQTTVGYGQALETCDGATYGGDDCLCAICDDQKSLSLDCSMYDERATSNGCYLLSDAIPALRSFDEPSRTNAQPRRTVTNQMLSSEPNKAVPAESSHAPLEKFHVISICMAAVASILLA